MKIGFLGVGNMGYTILKSLKEAHPQYQYFASNRSEGKLQKLREELQPISLVKNNEELVEQTDIIFVGVKPQDFYGALEPIANSFDASQTIISIAAGIQIHQIKTLLPEVGEVVRVMPNTPSKINSGVIGYCHDNQNEILDEKIKNLLKPLGKVFKVAEGENFEAFTVAASSGVGFIFELMQYWQDWLEEHDFTTEEARNITISSFLGTAQLAANHTDQSLEQLQTKVVSKKGVTAEGLNSIREHEVERILRISFEKAVLRDREISRGY